MIQPFSSNRAACEGLPPAVPASTTIRKTLIVSTFLFFASTCLCSVASAAPVATTLTLSSSQAPSTNGISVTFTATLAPYNGSNGTTDGEVVSFYLNSSLIGTGTLSSGVATFPTATLPVGTASANQVQAKYAGDANFSASTSSSIGQEVDAPTYNWSNVAISGAGALVPGAIVHPIPGGPVYIRTDVGGAYRWNANASVWVPITDSITFEQRQYFPIESLAVDPSDVNTVYIAGGTRTSGIRALFKSTDQGNTWTMLSPGLSSVPMAGNQDRRWVGERLQVDPSNSSVLLFGSRTTGLWRSTNGGVNWTQISSIPVPSDIYGVQSVVFDQTTAGKVYASVSGYGVYMSTDDGVTFTSIGGSTSPRRMAVSSTGVLWYTNSTGVSKYTGGVWTSYTPGPNSPTSGQIYCGLAINPTNPNDILVGKSEYFYYDSALYRTLNGGATWSQVNYTVSSTATWFNAILPSETWKWRTTDLAFNPSNTSVIYGGQWRTDNINSSPAFTQYEYGHEEDVMNALLTPPSGYYELLTGSFDDDGFAMNNGLTVFPSQQLGVQGSWNGETWGMAYEESAPLNMARIGAQTYYGGAGLNVTVSNNGGGLWTRLANYPTTLFPSDITMSATNNSNIVIIASAVYSSDSTGKSWPSSLTAVNPWRYTLDGGNSWNVSSGLPTPPSYVGQTNFPVSLAADRVNGTTFYYYIDNAGVNPKQGQVYRSTDSGATWTLMNASNLLPAKTWHVLKSRPGVQGDLWFASDDDSLTYQSFETRPSSTEGLYHSSNGGATWTKLSNVSRAFTFGFGMPTTTGPATIFIYGRANGDTTDSIYRSVDLGTTWVNIQASGNYLGDFPAYLEGSRQTFGRVFVGSQGRGVYYGSTQ